MRTLLKVLGVIAIIGVATIVLLAISGVYIARNIHVQQSGSKDRKNVSIDTPFGHFGVHANENLNPEAIGIPIYPGASRSDHSGGADFSIDSGDLHKDVTVAGAQFFTDDSTEKVREFYQDKFPSWHVKFEDNATKMEMKDGNRIRMISIKRENDRTVIGVASIGPPAAN